METIEYRTIDKAAWGPGQWQDEPDKKQWRDPATGLPCLAVRNSSSGNWCGYVGVAEGHPWHGTHYSSCTLPTATPRGERAGDERWGGALRHALAQRQVCGEDYCAHRPESRVEVHGGITFSDRCAPTGHDDWLAWCQRMEARRAEAQQYPEGDAARMLAELGGGLTSHEAWVTLTRERSICHLPEPGEPEDVWWFGFDCGHAWDYSPASEVRYGHHFSAMAFSAMADQVYRSLGYVERECAKLAAQLAAVQP